MRGGAQFVNGSRFANVGLLYAVCLIGLGLFWINSTPRLFREAAKKVLFFMVRPLRTFFLFTINNNTYLSLTILRSCYVVRWQSRNVLAGLLQYLVKNGSCSPKIFVGFFLSKFIFGYFKIKKTKQKKFRWSDHLKIFFFCMYMVGRILLRNKSLKTLRVLLLSRCEQMPCSN